MGLDPVSGIIGLGILTGVALAAYIEECRRENERRAENIRRLEIEARNEVRRQKAASKQEKLKKERDALAIRIAETRRLERELEQEEQRRRWNSDSRQTSNAYNRSSPRYYDNTDWFGTSSRYNMPYLTNNLSSWNSTSRYNPEPQYSENTFWDLPPIDFTSQKKNSVTVTFKPPQTTQNNNQNSKNQESNNRSAPSKSQGGTNSSGNASLKNTDPAPKPSTSGSQQPQRNNNNNNDKNEEKSADKDYGNLNDFIKKLKAILKSCKASDELTKKILSFFDDFDVHENNFIRILGAFERQELNIDIILSIVIQIFQSKYFANDVNYGNFLALMEFVAKYITDQLATEITADINKSDNKTGKSKKPFKEQLEECRKNVLQPNNIVTDIINLFEKIRKEIKEVNDSQPLDPDFEHIFTKVYHYFKHKDINGKEWTVQKYFDRVREMLQILKNLSPEYEELTDIGHPRRNIELWVYSKEFQGYFVIVVKSYISKGRIHTKILTFYLNERRDKKAKDGDKYVDRKKKDEKK